MNLIKLVRQNECVNIAALIIEQFLQRGDEEENMERINELAVLGMESNKVQGKYRKSSI